MFKIQILDTIECTCDLALANIIRPCLSYPAVFYKQGMYRKIRTEYEKSTMTKAGDVYFFFTGLLPRVLDFCKENNIPVEVEGELEKIPFSEPKLKGKTLRSEQIRLVTTALERQRGVLVSPTGCIAEGTFIRYNRRKKGCKRAIEHMFNLYHPDKNKKYPPRFNPEFPTKVRSFKEDENRILLHEIEDVVFSGEKECLSLTLEDGKTLQATPDHLIMTQKGWVQLGKLKKDIHLVMCDTPHTFKKVKSYKPFKEQCFCNLWYHPYGVSVPDRYGREGRTIRVEKSKITYEAHLNNLSVEEFLHCLRHDPERSKHFKFIDSKKHHIHHKDREHQNNSLDNLELMEKHKHLKLHAIKNKTNFHQGTPEFTKIKSIKKAGVKKTYDIICKDPYRNFSANDIIVHNSGKTLIALAVISSFMDKDTNVLWLCHTKDLMYQAGREAEKELGVEVGYIGDGNNDHDFKVTMATRQSFIKVAPELGWKYDVVVIDECFSPKTLVNSRTNTTIDQIKKGDLIFSNSGENKVLNVFQKKVPLKRVCKTTLSNGKEIFHSIDHLFATDEGWDTSKKNINLIALPNNTCYVMDNIIYKKENSNEKTITSEIKMRILRKRIHSQKNHRKKILQSDLLLQTQTGREKIHNNSRNYELHPLWKRTSSSPFRHNKRSVFSHLSRRKDISREKKRKSLPHLLPDTQEGGEVLFKKMLIQRSCEKKNLFGYDEKDKHFSKRNNLRENENKQPFKESANGIKANSNKEVEWNFNNKRTRWERERSYGSGTNSAILFGKQMETQSFSKNFSWKKNSRISSMLQNRRIKFRINDRDRSGWWKSQNRGKKKSGSKEGEKTERIRVESVEIYQQGSNDESFLGVIGDKERDQSFVEFYDLEVENDHNYFVEGVLVHNCHHLSKFDSQYTTLMRSVLSPVRIGLTATIPKDKQAVLAIEAFLGPVIEEITVKEGQERGTMAEIKMKFLKVPLSHSIRDLRKYQDVYDAGVVNRREQHELIARTCKRHVGEGDAILILVTRIQHGENILAELKRQGVKAYFAQGNTESSVRNDLKDALNNKDIHCLIATTIFQEGINIPELNVLINAAGGKSEIRTIQAIGRGLRVTDTKKVLTCYDIMSLDHPYLVSHLAERLAVYSEMRWLE